MLDSQIYHWLIRKSDGGLNSVFAPLAHTIENFERIGECVASPEFLLPLVFALEADDSLQNGVGETERRYFFSLHRDECDDLKPAFLGMKPLKVALLTSDLTKSIGAFVESLQLEFLFLKLFSSSDSVFELGVRFGPCSVPLRLRAEILLTCGLEMMAYSRGLKCLWEESRNG